MRDEGEMDITLRLHLRWWEFWKDSQTRHLSCNCKAWWWLMRRRYGELCMNIGFYRQACLWKPRLCLCRRGQVTSAWWLNQLSHCSASSRNCVAIPTNEQIQSPKDTGFRWITVSSIFLEGDSKRINYFPCDISNRAHSLNYRQPLSSEKMFS